MNGFISNILGRNKDGAISPRLPGMFEYRRLTADTANSTLGFTLETVEPNDKPGEFTENLQPQSALQNGINKREKNDRTETPYQTTAGNETIQEFQFPVSDPKTKAKKINVGEVTPELQQTSLTERTSKEFLSGKSSSFTLQNPVHHGDGYGKKIDHATDSLNASIPFVIKPFSDNGDIRALNRLSNVENISSKKSQLPERGINPVIKNANTTLFPRYVERANERDHPSVIKVSIGRIEVRAVQQPNPVIARENRSQLTKVTLEEYLKKRNSAE